MASEPAVREKPREANLVWTDGLEQRRRFPISFQPMPEVNCSVVVYLPEPLREFLDGLRRRLNPRFANWRAHVSILPPRLLSRPPEEMLEQLRERCLVLDPFETTLAEVQTFWPVNGVVYLSISRGADRLTEFHERLNSGGLERVEPYPYVPHVTIAQELDEAAPRVLEGGVRDRVRSGARASAGTGRRG